MCGFAFSHSGHFDCTLIAKRQVAKLANGMSRVCKYFVAEIETLKKLILEEEVEQVKKG
jgi:hypothetical protein